MSSMKNKNKKNTKIPHNKFRNKTNERKFHDPEGLSFLYRQKNWTMTDQGQRQRHVNKEPYKK